MKVYWVHSTANNKALMAHAISATVPLADIVRSSTICWSTIISPVESHRPKCKNCINRMGKGERRGRKQLAV